MKYFIYILSLLLVCVPGYADEYCSKYNIDEDPEAKLSELKFLDNANAQYCVGAYYYHGKGIKKDYRKAYEWTLNSARRNYPPAITNIGIFHFFGIGVPVDKKAAEQWLLKGVEHNDVRSQTYLGHMYFSADGVKKNDSLAFELIRNAANKKHPQAMGMLGLFFLKGVGTNVNENKAFHWLKKAANEGDAQAQYNLSLAYSKGLGTRKNTTDALKWLINSAEQEHITAQNTLAKYYYNGRDVEKDIEKAFSWFLRSAKHGDADSQYNVGTFYWNGMGVKRNHLEGIKWLAKSAKKNNQNAIDTLQNFTSPLKWRSPDAKLDANIVLIDVNGKRIPGTNHTCDKSNNVRDPHLIAGDKFYSFVYFLNCKHDPNGHCMETANIAFFAPDWSLLKEHNDLPLLNGMDNNNNQTVFRRSDIALSITLEPEDHDGQHRIIISISDENKESISTMAQTFTKTSTEDGVAAKEENTLQPNAPCTNK